MSFLPTPRSGRRGTPRLRRPRQRGAAKTDPLRLSSTPDGQLVARGLCGSAPPKRSPQECIVTLRDAATFFCRFRVHSPTVNPQRAERGGAKPIPPAGNRPNGSPKLNTLDPLPLLAPSPRTRKTRSRGSQLWNGFCRAIQTLLLRQRMHLLPTHSGLHSGGSESAGWRAH